MILSHVRAVVTVFLFNFAFARGTLPLSTRWPLAFLRVDAHRLFPFVFYVSFPFSFVLFLILFTIS